VRSEVLLVDHGMGNLRSVARALEHAGAKPRISTDPDEVRRADRIVVPGVGSLGDCMRALRERGLDEALRERLARGRPYLGICLGLHVLLESGEEGKARCLGVVPGRVERFPESSDLVVPHMGWNAVEVVNPHPLLRDGYYYFVHAFRACQVPDEVVVGQTEYGGRFASAVGSGTWLAVQFHPEKSQRAGLALLERFTRWSP
jgi:glutamine amidotransferase